MVAKKKPIKKSKPTPTATPKPLKKKSALSNTTSKTVRGVEALYGDKKKRRSEQPRSTKFKIAGKDSNQLRYRKVNYK